MLEQKTVFISGAAMGMGALKAKTLWSAAGESLQAYFQGHIRQN